MNKPPLSLVDLYEEEPTPAEPSILDLWAHDGPAPPPPPPPSRQERALALYREGHKPADVAALVGCSEQTVRHWAIAAGIWQPWRSARNPANKPPEILMRDSEVVRRYLAGENAQALADAFKVSRERICQILRRDNIIEHRNERKREARDALKAEADTIKSEAKAETEAKSAKVVEAVRSGMSLARAGRLVGWTPGIAARACERVGLTVRMHGRWKRDDYPARFERIRELRAAGATLNAICDTLKAEGNSCSPTWLYNHWQEIWPGTLPPRDKNGAKW
jgi:Homeodomain-like domain